MAKLHELLAVAASKNGQATKVLTDLSATFGSKHHLFTKKLVIFTPIAEGAAPVTEEQQALNTTVTKELSWAARHVADMIDIGHAINTANCSAKADVILEDGTILVRDIPATTLLELEKHLAAFKTLIAAAPTLDPAKGFTEDKNEGEGIHKAREVVKSRTQKKTEWKVVVPATPQHPAQVKEMTDDIPVGTIRQNEWSGMITPSEKAEKLERVENLLRAVKSARSRANEIEAKSTKIGKNLTDYVLG